MVQSELLNLYCLKNSMRIHSRIRHVAESFSGGDRSIYTDMERCPQSVKVKKKKKLQNINLIFIKMVMYLGLCTHSKCQ